MFQLQLTNQTANQKPYKYIWFMCKIKIVCQIEYGTPICIMDHCLIIPVYKILRKYNLLPLIPYKGTYHYTVEWNPYKLHNSSYGQLYFYWGNHLWTGDFNGG